MRRIACLLTILVLTVAAGSCKRFRSQSEVRTETIEPAPAQPAPTETEAMTQTVDIEDSRSEEEGAAAIHGTTADIHGTHATETAPAKRQPKKPDR